eukprot:1821274-Rhodomonas_salina.2
MPQLSAASHYMTSGDIVATSPGLPAATQHNIMTNAFKESILVPFWQNSCETALLCFKYSPGACFNDASPANQNPRSC